MAMSHKRPPQYPDKRARLAKVREAARADADAKRELAEAVQFTTDGEAKVKKPRKRLSPEKRAANAAKTRQRRAEDKELREAEKWHWPAK